MKFSVLPARSWPSASARGQAFLRRDNWDDFGYKTLFHLSYVDADGTRTDVGAVKIASFGMAKGRSELPAEFDPLSSDSFSLGQDDDYYARLHGLGPQIRDEILTGLKDIAVRPLVAR